jgi:aryl-alcohol dehydrogenase-like predicted oxidoreductase
MTKIILGTVQMGINYGINNNSGKISLKESHEILLKAYLSGITSLDTAEAYGNAHKVIGDFHKCNPTYKFQIITKVPHDIEVDSLDSKIKEYIKELEVKCLDVLMFHSFESYINNPKAIEVLVDLKSKGYINHIGVSVYTNSQIEFLLDKDDITIVQLPFNLLDNYNSRGNLISLLKAKGKIVHTRSAFLQGLFFKKTNDENKIVKKLHYELGILNNIVLKLNCSMEQLALSYCLYQKDIDNVIIGVDSVNHLQTNINASLYKITDNTIKEINAIKVADLNTLNPSLWQEIPY